MSPSSEAVLVLNCGSSSVKLAVVDPRSGRRSVTGLAERIGAGGRVGVRLRLHDGERSVEADATHAGVLAAALSALPADLVGAVGGVGHRVVHGGHRFTTSVVVDDTVITALESMVGMAPLHIPANVQGMRAAAEALPGVRQVAVFDTGFHHTLPPRAFRYAVPKEWYVQHGARRFGFHGISVRHVAARAVELLGRPPDEVRLVVAHLGNGCSATAVSEGVSVDTTMGFTPLEGLVMGTRSGDVDPGLLAYLGPRLGLDLAGLVDVLNTRSGLAGLSGIGNDVRSVVEAATSGDVDASLALEVFAYRLAKSVAALAVPLGRLDALVFTGGVGENSALIRSMVMRSLDLLGIQEDTTANDHDGRHTDGRVSGPVGPVVLVVPTDEELVIARDTAALLAPWWLATL